MAKQQVTTRELELIVNGEKADASIDELNGAFKRLNKEVKKLPENSDDFVKKSKDLGKVEKRLKALKARAKEYADEQSRGTKIMNSFKKGIFDLAAKGGVALAGFFAVQKAIEFGNKMDEVGRKFIDLRRTISSTTGASGADLDEMTTKVAALGDVFDTDYSQILQAVNTRAQVSGETQVKALESVEAAMIKAGDQQDEYLEKVKEYSVQAREAGIQTDELNQILLQEIRGGVFGDKLIDTVKEVGLRIRELTPATKAALDALGKEFADDLVKKVNSGELSISQALISIRNRANEVGLSTQELQTLVADLGGGPLEDLGGLEEAFKQLSAAQQINLNELTEQEQKQKAVLDATKELTAANNDFAKEYEEIAHQSDIANKQIQVFIIKGVTRLLQLFKEFKKRVTEAIQPLIDRLKNISARLNETGALADSLKRFFTETFSVIGAQLKSTGELILGIIDFFVSWYEQSTLLQGLLRFFFESIIAGIKTFFTSAKTVVDIATDLLGIFKSILTLDFQGFLDSTGDLFVNFGKNVLSIFSDIGEAIVNTFDSSGAQEAAEARRLEELQKSQEKERKLRDEQAKQKAADEAKRAEEERKRLEQEEAKKKAIQEKSAREQAAAARAQGEKLRAAREKYQKQVLEAERNLEDLRISNIEDSLERELAQIELNTKRRIAALVGTPEQVREATELINQERERLRTEAFQKEFDSLSADQDKREAKLEEAFQRELERLDEEDELKRLKAEEKYLLALETQAERDLAFLDLEKTRLEAERELRKTQGKLTTAEEQKFTNAILKVQKERADREAEITQKTAELKTNIRELEYQNFRDLVGLTIQLFGESEGAQKASVLLDAAFAIADVIINTQKGIVAFAASVAPLGPAGAPLLAAYTGQAKLRQVLSIAAIGAQAAAKFEDGGLIKLASGGLVRGRRHAQGGIRIPGTGIEVEGDEYVINRMSTANSREAIEAINAHPNVRFAAVPISERRDGGDISQGNRGEGSPDPDDQTTLVGNNNAVLTKLDETNALLRVLISILPDKLKFVRKEFTDAEARDDQTLSDNTFN